MKIKEPGANDVAFTVKQTWFGLVVMKRVAIPSESYGWEWGKWRKATLTDLAYILCRLRGD